MTTSFRRVPSPWRYGIATLHVIIVAAIVTLAINRVADHFSPEPFAPLYGDGYDDQQSATDSVVAGGMLISIATKCSHLSGIGVTGIVTMRKIQPPPLPPQVLLFSGSRDVEKGCVTNTYATLIPADTEPGTYQVTGAEQATDVHGHVQKIVWRSEHFEVTAR